MTQDDDLVGELFREAVQARPQPSPQVMARILADAAAAQPRPAAALPAGAARPAAGPGWLAVLSDWFGGGLPLAGMTAAAGVGLYLGVAQPAIVLTLAETLTQPAIERVELMPDQTGLWAME
jgi:hypothetical protein